MTKAKEMFYKLGYRKYYYEAIPKLLNKTKPSDNINKFKCEGYNIQINYEKIDSKDIHINYEKIDSKDIHINYEKIDSKDIHINFIKNEDGIFFDKSEDGNAIPIIADELKAIIEQCKELGCEINGRNNNR